MLDLACSCLMKLASLDVPLLWIRGSYDNIALSNYASADYSDAPKHKLNESHLINAGHCGTPNKGKQIVIDWINKVISANQ